MLMLWKQSRFRKQMSVRDDDGDAFRLDTTEQKQILFVGIASRVPSKSIRKQKILKNKDTEGKKGEDGEQSERNDVSALS